MQPIPTLDQIPFLEPIPPRNQIRLFCPNCDSDSGSENKRNHNSSNLHGVNKFTNFISLQATFFINAVSMAPGLGRDYAAFNRETLKNIVEDGHDLGDHR